MPNAHDPTSPVVAAAEREETRRVSRRSFFTAGATIAAASMATATSAAAQQGTSSGSTKNKALKDMVKKLLQTPTQPGFDPFKKSTALASKGYDSALSRLVRRITNGTTPDEMALARKLGFYGYLNYHLGASKIDDATVQSYVSANYPLLTQDANQLYSQDQRMVYDQLVDSTLYRAAWSRRQLYERMVEFWSDHFNIEFDKVTYLKTIDDHDVIRKHALGKFPDLLKASAQSPAMLEYLDNTRNRAPNVNQNYAREIMELHTLGVDGGYTQQDVAEMSRVLSGWTMAPRGAGFVFDPAGHDFGQKVVLGITIPAANRSVGAAAKAEGDKIIDVLVNHASTAKFISRKMLRFLLRYDPSDAQVATVAGVYLKTKGDIPSMIRAVLSPENLLTSSPRYRRPYSYILAALRATDAQPTKVSQVSQRWLGIVGQSLFAWGPPDGYPDRADYWAGTALQRWNFAYYLMTNSGDVPVDVGLFTRVNTVDGVLDAISDRLFGGEMPVKLRQQLSAYASTGQLTQGRVKETVALALGSQQFQWI
ncbi:MAG: DUF1800 domain-containing protein [Gemmatimonadaceae bacterium]